MIQFSIFLTSIFLVILLFVLINNTNNIINKIVISNSSTTIVSCVIILIGTLYQDSNYVDIAIIYSLLGFGVSAALLFFVNKDTQKEKSINK